MFEEQQAYESVGGAYVNGVWWMSLTAEARLRGLLR